MELKLKSDTVKRKHLFIPESFAHPAKCHIGMLEYLLQEYTSHGEVVLDPMAGSGSILIGALMGRHIICVELEAKFVKMCEDNLKKILEMPLYLGTKERGQVVILQGDARNLAGILADRIITSPTYGNPRNTSEEYDDKYDLRRPKGVAWGRESFRGRYGKTEGQIGNLPYGQVDAVMCSPPYEGTEARDRSKESWWDEEREKKMSGGSAKIAKGYQPDTIKQVDAILTSPPYEGSIMDGNENFEGLRHLGTINKWNIEQKRQQLREYQYGEETTAYGKKQIDAILTSPPYEGSLQGESHDGLRDAQKLGELTKQNPNRKWKRKTELTSGRMRAWGTMGLGYSPNETNIGNLKSTSYLEAMLAVYQQCFSVLRDGGLLILITKNFIREQKEIRLDLDTIKLCEQVGFILKERHYRRLTQQSFWRTIYRHKFPDAPVLDKEDILVFEKPMRLMV